MPSYRHVQRSARPRQLLLIGSRDRRERLRDVLVRDRPLSINLFEAESRSHQVAQLPAVRIGASAPDESKCITDLIAGREVQVFKFEFAFAFKLWLPITPARPVRLTTLVGQRGQNVIDHGVFGMMTENLTEPAFARVLSPKLEDFTNVFGVLHIASSLNEQRASKNARQYTDQSCKVGYCLRMLFGPTWNNQLLSELTTRQVPHRVRRRQPCALAN